LLSTFFTYPDHAIATAHTLGNSSERNPMNP